MLSDFIPSLKKNIEDRLTNPIAGTFVLSWVIVNWKPILFVILSELEIGKRINVVETEYFDINHMVTFPLLFTTFYLIALPWILYWLEKLQNFATSKRQIFKLETELKMLKYKTSVEEQKKKYNSLMRDDEEARNDERRRLFERLDQVGSLSGELREIVVSTRSQREKQGAIDSSYRKLELLKGQLGQHESLGSKLSTYLELIKKYAGMSGDGFNKKEITESYNTLISEIKIIKSGA